MRTTIRIDDELLSQVRQLAARTRRTLTAVMEDALRQILLRSREAGRAGRVALPTFSAKLMPGVDLDDSASLLDLMEAEDAAP